MKNFKIKILSPLHIGDNDTKTMSSLADFVIEKNFIRTIDHKKLENIFMKNPAIMEDYIKEVKEHSGQKYSLKSFLDRYKIPLEEVTSSEIVPTIGKINAKEIHPFISENGKRYIPGSTIKGAIRNALAFVYLQKHPDFKQKIKNSDIKKPNFNYFEKQIFGRNPFNDILKFLQVSDSLLFASGANAIYASLNFHLKNGVGNSIPINLECIVPEQETKIRMKIKEKIPKDILKNIDKNFWKEFLSFSKIFEALNSLSISFIKREIEELNKNEEMQASVSFYRKLLSEIEKSENKSAYFCVGKGTTIMGKTILLAFSKNELEELRNKIKNTKVSKNFGWKKVNREKESSEIFPVTRLVYKNQSNFLASFGWVKMEEE